ncbi:MAG TPA: response regulator [Castellaniella sp.]|uniref:response regulator n=1 Tax=Castellaniella sp. TaxID=1955812 RepID=UPI002F1FD106
MARILVVDDEIGIRELLSEILYDEGHTVELAENATQAREYRLRQRPDLVLLDIWMPDIDGVTLLKEWSSQGLLNMPVIMMSGHATVDTAVEATRIGAVDFLEKPITLQKLLKSVAAGLARAVIPASMRSRTERPLTTESLSTHLPVPMGAAQAVSPSPPAVGTAPADASHLGSISLNQPLREARDAFERIYFEYHLDRENHSMTRVSERTGLERTHLYRKLKQLGIETSRKKAIS